MRKLLLFANLIILALPSNAQIVAPQINLSGNIGCQGFPCLNNGTVQFTSDANRSMTAVETSATGGIKVTSTVTLTATRDLTLPSGNFQFIAIENATTGGQSIRIIGLTGTGVTIPNGSAATVWFDGTNVVQTGSPGGGGSVGSSGTPQSADGSGGFQASLPLDILRTFGNPVGSLMHGDSIGAGTGATNISLGFANLIRPQLGGRQTQFSNSGDQCLDQSVNIIGNDGFPTGSYPTSVQECGTNDVTQYGTNADLQTVFKRVITGNYLMAAVPLDNQKWAQTCTKTTGFPIVEDNFRIGMAQSTTASGDVLTCPVNSGPGGNVAVYYRITNGGTGTFTISIAGTPQTDHIGSLGTTFDAFGDNGANITTPNVTTMGWVGQVFTGFTPNTTVNVVFTTTAASTTLAPVSIGFVAGLPATSTLNPNLIVVSPNHQNNANDTLSGTYAGFEQSIVSTLVGQGLNITYANTRDGMVADPLCGNGSVATMYTNCYADTIHPNGPTATTGGHASMARIIAAAVPSLITNAPPNLQNGPQNVYQPNAAIPLNPSQFWTPNPFMRTGSTAQGWAPGVLLWKSGSSLQFVSGTTTNGAVLAGPNQGGNRAASLCVAGLAGSGLYSGFGSYTLASLRCPIHADGNGRGALGDDTSGHGGFHASSGAAYIGDFSAIVGTGTANVTVPFLSWVSTGQATASVNYPSVSAEFLASEWTSGGGGTPGFLGVTWNNIPRSGTNASMYMTLGTLHNPIPSLFALDISGATTPNILGNVTATQINGVSSFAPTAATFTAGTNVTSVTCVSSTCNSSRGRVTIVGGTATTGTIATVAFPATAVAQVCETAENGGATFLGIGNSTPSTTGFNITAGVTVSGLTFDVSYSCRP